jgi:peptidoglycan/xylan/chitin deacetylase (PgdA/CDA1 family)
MKLRRVLLLSLLLAWSFIILTGLGIAVLLFINTPENQPDISEAEPDFPEIETVTDDPDIMDIQTNDILTDIKPISNAYVREIPLPLTSEMEERLEQFRKNARLLHEEYPEHFLISLPATEKTAALTFDDGPDNSSTPEIVEILNTYRVPATFFLIGWQMENNMDTIQYLIDSGHTLANHSWSHVRPTDAAIEEMMNEVGRAQEKLDAVDAGNKLFRPPYGLVNRTQMPALIDAGYQVIGWSVDSMDWYFDKPEDIVTCVVENIHPGAIVLLHSSGGPANRKATIEALPLIIETLLEQGYRFVALK